MRVLPRDELICSLNLENKSVVLSVSWPTFLIDFAVLSPCFSALPRDLSKASTSFCHLWHLPQ